MKEQRRGSSAFPRSSNRYSKSVLCNLLGRDGHTTIPRKHHLIRIIPRCVVPLCIYSRNKFVVTVTLHMVFKAISPKTRASMNYGVVRCIRNKSKLCGKSTSIHYLHRWPTMALPCSCHSSLLIHSWWNVPKLAKILPPSHAPYRRSTGLPGAWILT